MAYDADAHAMSWVGSRRDGIQGARPWPPSRSPASAVGRVAHCGVVDGVEANEDKAAAPGCLRANTTPGGGFAGRTNGFVGPLRGHMSHRNGPKSITTPLSLNLSYCRMFLAEPRSDETGLDNLNPAVPRGA